MSGPVATLRSRASHVVRRIIAYEHRLGERVLPLVTERQEHSAPAPGQPELPRAPGEHEGGRLASLAPHLELAPAHAEPEPRAERLETGLLGREARGEVRHRIAPGAAVRDLRLGEDTLQEPVPPAVDHVAHARDVDEVDADAVDPHAGSLTDLGPDEPRELVRHGAHARAVGPLDHHARQRLRARVANEDSPGAVHLALEGRDALGEPGEGVDRRLRLHGDVPEDLRELGQAPGERGERLARLRGDAEQGERRENAVARGGVVEEQEVPRLLAAEVRAEALHLLGHVAVPHLGLDDADARGVERLVQAEVGHDGRDDDVPLEPTARGEVTARDGERVVPVPDRPRVIDGDQPVAVAVERKADRGAPGAHRPLQSLGVERAAAGVDVPAVGAGADRQDAGAEPPEDARRHAIRRAVGAVEHDGEPAELEREGPAEEVDVVRLRARVGDEAADLGAPRARRTVVALEALLDLVLPGVGELRALRGEQLDAVVLERVVRRAEDDAAVGAELLREERDRRRREHADGVAVGAGGEQPRHERGLEQRPRQTRVASEHEPYAVGPVLDLQRRDELASDPEREVGRERLLVGDAADPVGAEQTRHRPVPSRPPCVIGSSGLISTVTSTLDWPVRYTDSGSTSPTLWVTVSRRPAVSTGTASTAVRPSIVERGPLTCTVAGSTVTRTIAWPGSGTPRTRGTTCSVLAMAPASITWRRAGV